MPINIKSDELTGYVVAGLDTSSDPMYFGYINKLGHWYIMKMSISVGDVTWVKGIIDYPTNWGDRVNLTYSDWTQI